MNNDIEVKSQKLYYVDPNTIKVDDVNVSVDDSHKLVVTLSAEAIPIIDINITIHGNDLSKRC